ncbi:MAG: class I SAM-dependent methyltransferase [Vicinamibacteria bacterium]|nr:class I SAM-dependent methyltransferase [Vicinamibacteria bacterium]
MIKRLLENPLTRGLPLDSPATTHVRRQVIATKPFLRRIYEEWYSDVARHLPPGPGRVLELGSGAGFLHEHVPDVIRSEIFHCPDMSVVLDGCHLPFAPRSLRAIVMTDVLHHVPDVRRFFAEATEAVREDGAMVLVEPWVTPWSRFVYGSFHHEPFLPEAPRWEFATTGPLSGANGALPWIVFERDRATFEREFPAWRIEVIRPGMPFCYLVSGGVSLRSLMPGWSYGAWRGLERALQPLMGQLAMFATIVLRRVPTAATASPRG